MGTGLMGPAIALLAAVPEVIGAAALAPIAEAAGVAAIEGSVTFLGLTSAQVGGAILLGASLGVSLALQPSVAKNPMDKSEETIRQALPARTIAIGEVLLGGAVHLYEKSQVHTSLVIAKIMCAAPIHAVSNIYFNNVEEALDTGKSDQGRLAVLSGTYAGQIVVEPGYGRYDQGPSPLLSHDIPDIGWTAADVAKGLAYIAAEFVQGSTLEIHHDQFPNGVPDVTCAVQGVSLPDPRFNDPANPATWTYSRNAALAVLRFLLDIDGWGHTTAMYDLASFAAAADICDQIVDGDGRYVAAGIYSTTEDRAATLGDLLEACDGRLIEQPDGRAKLYVGAYAEPAIVITAAQVIDAEFERFGDIMERVDLVKPR